ncbi:hypothetical protein AKJ09_00793 [Labilithrix luteola]|uniref:Uncharacterized protein n=1 Tax=Labilithrix luteola TaxID=1391654 RepID=A0A0K1PLZ3_9BACT|nr:hypothetical protein AKJ09_00793 [Labilithrix luteola]
MVACTSDDDATVGLDVADAGANSENSPDSATRADDAAVSTFSVSGKVIGLAGKGLVLTNNAGDAITVAPGADGSFSFASKLAKGAAYAVAVKTQPSSPSQTCVVTSGAGTIGGASVTNVVVTCTTNTYKVSGKVMGLAGAGLVVKNNGGDAITLSPAATDGAAVDFTFSKAIASGEDFEVTVETQPSSPTQSCVVTGGEGTVVAGDVATVAINCTTNTYTVGGTVTGLKGSGLVLQNEDGDDLPINATGTFAFVKQVASGKRYSVKVKTQPGAPEQTCEVTSNTGTVTNANVTDVAVDCTTNTYTVGVTVSGLKGTGLVLQNNGGDDLTIDANGDVTFGTPVASGTKYEVSVKTNPYGNTCTVTAGGAGTVTNAKITNVAVTCVSIPAWYQPNYDGVPGPWSFVSNRFFDGEISCTTTCAFYGRVPSGIRFICNAQGQTTEGCTPANDGQYGLSNCGAVVDNDVLTAPVGNIEQCAGSLTTCYKLGNTCNERVSFHSIQCQCK